MQFMLAGAAAIATLGLFEAAQPGQTSAASDQVRLVDRVIDVPQPPPPPPAPLLLPPGTVLPPGTMILPGGYPIPPLPPGYSFSPDMMQILTTQVPQMLDQGREMLAAGPPPNVPNEVCRYNTVRVACPPLP
jgi:hypothetical protein